MCPPFSAKEGSKNQSRNGSEREADSAADGEVLRVVRRTRPVIRALDDEAVVARDREVRVDAELVSEVGLALRAVARLAIRADAREDRRRSERLGEAVLGDDADV